MQNIEYMHFENTICLTISEIDWDVLDIKIARVGFKFPKRLFNVPNPPKMPTCPSLFSPCFVLMEFRPYAESGRYVQNAWFSSLPLSVAASAPDCPPLFYLTVYVYALWKFHIKFTTSRVLWFRGCGKRFAGFMLGIGIKIVAASHVHMHKLFFIFNNIEI